MPIEDVFSDLVHRSADGIDAPTGLVERGLARGRARRRRTTVVVAAAGAALAATAVAGTVIGLAAGEDRSAPPVVQDPTPTTAQRVPIGPADAEILLSGLLGDGLEAVNSDESDGQSLSVRGTYDAGRVTVGVYRSDFSEHCTPGADDGCTRTADGWVLVSTPGLDAHAEDEFNRATFWTGDGWIVQATAHENDDSLNQPAGADHWAVLEYDELTRVATSTGWLTEAPAG